MLLFTAALSVYSVVSLTGPHGVSALQAKFSRMGELQENNADYAKRIAEKRARVRSLEQGQNLDQELHNSGRTHPDEIEYKVAEPGIPDAADDDPNPVQ